MPFFLFTEPEYCSKIHAYIFFAGLMPARCDISLQMPMWLGFKLYVFGG